MSYSGFPFAEFDCIALGYLSSPTRQLFALHGKIWNVAKRVYGVLEKLWKDRGGNMPEVILPCPATMSDAELLKLRHRFDDVCQSSTTPELFELCRAGSHLVDAIRSLPRSLTWTHEPPKVAGWYWFSMGKGHAVCLLVCADGKAKIAKDHFTDADMLGGEWAGPIAPPIES